MLCYEGVKLRIGVPITIHEGRPRYRSGSQHSPKHGPRAGILSTEYSSVNPKPNVPNAERIRSRPWPIATILRSKPWHCSCRRGNPRDGWPPTVIRQSGQSH